MRLDLSPGTYRNELCRARTFGFMRDVAKLWSAGFALGASFENTLVVTESRALAEEWTYRFLAAALVHHAPQDAA